VRVLIVDDSVVMRRILEQALRHSSLGLREVLQAANGVEGLAALERATAEGDPLDLVLCDLHMPVLDGLGFLLEKQRRKLAPNVPVLMITAESGDPEMLEAMKAGAQGQLSKTFTLDEMERSVASVLHHVA